MTKRKHCFTSCACVTGCCPNIQCDEIEELYGIPASDAGHERIKCKDCIYNTGECEDCLFCGDADYCPDCGVKMKEGAGNGKET